MKENENIKRHKLSEVLPLEAPYAVNINISNACNFQCFYCFQSESGKKKFKEGMMQYDIFQQCIDHIKDSRIRLKNLNLCGYGEPLLHRDFCRMVQYVKEQEVTDCVETITNASLLTPEYCDRIIASGLDKIRISLQGLSSEDYKEISKANINFEKLTASIQYLCEHKEKLYVYIKIMDVMVKTEELKKKFYGLFEKYADKVYIESLMPLSELDYSKADSNFDKTLYGMKVLKVKVCTQPFYSCTVDIDGTIFPCCMLPVPETFGNLAKDSLNQVWNGKQYISFLISLLNGKAYQKKPECKQCNRYQYVFQKEDSLEEKEQEIIERYSKKWNKKERE